MKIKLLKVYPYTIYDSEGYEEDTLNQITAHTEWYEATEEEVKILVEWCKRENITSTKTGYRYKILEYINLNETLPKITEDFGAFVKAKERELQEAALRAEQRRKAEAEKRKKSEAKRAEKLLEKKRKELEELEAKLKK